MVAIMMMMMVMMVREALKVASDMQVVVVDNDRHIESGGVTW